MAAKRMDLNVPTFLVLSGCSNPLGQTLAQELCGRLAAGSVALLLDESPEQLQTLAQLLSEQQQVQPDAVQIFTGQRLMDAEQLMEQILQKNDSKGCFQRSIIVHNEGDAATHVLIEPQSPKEWNAYVERQLMAPVALNQRWLRAKQLAGVEKLVINVTSSLQVRPLIFNTLLCSCKRARDMYFRAMAAEEQRSNVHVLSYAAGLFKTHDTQLDINGNIVDPEQLLGGMDHQKEQKALPRVQPLQSTLKLINILEQKAFVSGHDVDYYDTFVL